MTKILSDEGTLIFEIGFYTIICGSISFFGITANTINIIIFYRQGLKNTVNIGFFTLAISDIACLVSLQCISIGMNPLFVVADVPWHPMEVLYISAGWPHVCFSRITSFITAYITAERYISIALPLKVKQIITPKKTTIILSLIYIVNLMSLVPEYATTFLGWRFVPSRNRTLIALIFTSSRGNVEGVVYVLHSILGILSFLGVIVFTSLLVTKFGQSSQWRTEVTSSQSNSTARSLKDKKTVKLVVLIASILIACYTPGAVFSLATFTIDPEFSIGGKYMNIWESMWSIAFTCQAINSSVNIFLYYSMSTKYRQTFDELILRRKNSH